MNDEESRRKSPKSGKVHCCVSKQKGFTARHVCPMISRFFDGGSSARDYSCKAKAHRITSGCRWWASARVTRRPGIVRIATPRAQKNNWLVSREDARRARRRRAFFTSRYEFLFIRRACV